MTGLSLPSLSNLLPSNVIGDMNNTSEYIMQSSSSSASSSSGSSRSPSKSVIVRAGSSAVSFV